MEYMIVVMEQMKNIVVKKTGIKYEPRHHKTNIVRLRPAWIWTSLDLDQPEAKSDQDPCCSLSVSLLVKVLLSEQHGSWSDYADAQAGLDPCLSQTHYVGFVVTRLI
jgi:hypothetical protein